MLFVHGTCPSIFQEVLDRQDPSFSPESQGVWRTGGLSLHWGAVISSSLFWVLFLTIFLKVK